jgi:hypothetical protein
MQAKGLKMPLNRPGFIAEGWLHQAEYMRKVAARAAADAISRVGAK